MTIPRSVGRAMQKGASRKTLVPRKVDHKGRMFTHIPAQMASPSPPLGSQLGQIGVNIASFVKDFNLKTSIYKEGVPIGCYVTVNPDRSYNLRMNHPPWAYFIKQAGGVYRGAMDHEKETVGFLTRKHVYEIAKLKSEDHLWQEVDLQDICKKVIDMAYKMGVRVVDEIDPVEYKAFLENQAKIVEAQKAELQAAREAKLLRTLT